MSDIMKTDVLDAITANAEAEIAAINEKATAYAEKRRADALSRADEISLREAERAKIKAEDVRLKSLTAARMERNKIILSAKRKTVDRVYELVLDGLKKLDKTEFTALVAAAAEKYGEDGQTIILSSSAPVSAAEVSAIGQVKKKGMSVATSGELADGFVLSCDAYDRDFSYAAIAAACRERTEKQTADELFGEDK